ncbi:MAG: carbohydrate porin [Akkermansiaceae bacterium]|nr:carbohydrate porin [Akkermansiaceae bacterium]
MIGTAGPEAITPAPAPETAAEDTLFPVPNLSGDIWSRDVMTGDWGGARRKLAEGGVQVDFDLQNYFQGLVEGGVEQRWAYGGTSDLRLKFDTGKAGWWPGGFVEIHAEGYWGDGANARDGALLPANTDYLLQLAEGNGGYLPHLTITQFISEKIAVMLGKLDTSLGDMNSFAHVSGNDKFMNMAFGFNPVTTLATPYSALGAGLILLPTDDLILSLSAYDVEGNISETGFDTIFDDGTGYNVEVTLHTSLFGKPGHQLVGATYADGDFSVLSDTRLLLPILPGTPEMQSGTWNIYYNFEQYLQHDEARGTGWGLFGRVGFADEETSPIDLFLSGGIGGRGLLSSRPNDRFGIGYFYAHLTDELPRLARPFLRDAEQGLEVFYDAALTPWLRVAADAQVISPVLEAADTAVVLGVRSKISF